MIVDILANNAWQIILTVVCGAGTFFGAWKGMGFKVRRLDENLAATRKDMDRCSEILSGHLQAPGIHRDAEREGVIITAVNTRIDDLKEYLSERLSSLEQIVIENGYGRKR